MRWVIILATAAFTGGTVQAVAKRIEIKQRLDAIASAQAETGAEGPTVAQWLNNAPFNNFNNWENA